MCPANNLVFILFIREKLNLSVLLLMLSAASCINTKKAVYFNDIQDSTIPLTIEGLEPVIQKNDLLSITVSSLNTKATETFNAPNTASIQAVSTLGSAMQATGYLVDQDGYIQFPVLGKIKATGLTKKALTDNITKSLIDTKQLLDPIVNIRYLNYRVTVLGEVAHPTVVNVPNEKITLLEALGLAGDLTLYAKRDNIMVLREEGGQRVVKRLDLNSHEILTSPYFYLKTNDIVYVEPNKKRIRSTNRVTEWLPVVFSGLSLAAIIVDRYTR
jgi:polysaccharide export outer membrane protein